MTVVFFQRAKHLCACCICSFSFSLSPSCFWFSLFVLESVAWRSKLRFSFYFLGYTATMCLKIFADVLLFLKAKVQPLHYFNSRRSRMVHVDEHISCGHTAAGTCPETFRVSEAAWEHLPQGGNKSFGCIANARCFQIPQGGAPSHASYFKSSNHSPLRPVILFPIRRKEWGSVETSHGSLSSSLQAWRKPLRNMVYKLLFLPYRPFLLPPLQ